MSELAPIGPDKAPWLLRVKPAKSKLLKELLDKARLELEFHRLRSAEAEGVE